MTITIVCYAACGLALLAALLVVLQRHPMHALLYLILMLLSLAVVFFTLGAPFAAALQIVVYAGAIMVLFVFVVMMLNIAPVRRPRSRWRAVVSWGVPTLFALALFVLSVIALGGRWREHLSAGYVDPKAVGIALYRPYVLGVELVSLVLLAGLVAAFHLAPPPRGERPAPAVAAPEEAAHV